MHTFLAFFSYRTILIILFFSLLLLVVIAFACVLRSFFSFSFRMGLVDNVAQPLDIYPSQGDFFSINVRTPYFAV